MTNFTTNNKPIMGTPWLASCSINASNSKQKRTEKFKMGTVIRAKISPKNKYWIDKHRHYELKHFCMQYPGWKKAYSEFCASVSKTSRDLSEKETSQKAFYSDRIKLIEQTAYEADKCLYGYIIKGVTEGKSYTYMRTMMGIPCGRDMYYDRYRKFFWLLSQTRK